MNNFETNWNREQLRTYLLIYAANADFVESEEEMNFITSKVQADQVEAMRAEFEGDNDYQRIQKIRAALERLQYSKAELEALMQEMKALFMSDNSYDTLERNLFMGLKHILN